MVTLGGTGFDQLARWMSALGVAVEILEPPELREAVAAGAALLVAANAPASSGR